MYNNTPHWYIWYKQHLIKQNYQLDFGTRKYSDGTMQKFLDEQLENDLYKEVVFSHYFEENKRTKLKQD